jgi:hypothetical protein
VSKGAPRKHGWRIAALVAGVLVAAVAVAVAVALVITSQPGFYERYTGLQRRHTTLASSAHAGIDCVVCHTDPSQALGSASARVAEFYSSLVSTSTELSFVSFQLPTNDACLQCHRYAWSSDASKTANVPHPAHMRVADETRECVLCHKWVAHEETYQAKHTTMPFSAVCASFQCHVGTKASTDCQNCHHVLQGTAAEWVQAHPPVVRAVGPSACLEFCHKPEQCELCHTTGKTPVLPASVATASAGPIEQAHVKSDWLTQHGTTSLQDPARCSVCHISRDECADCHAQRPAFHDPISTWYTRHKDLATDTRRCLTCHEQPWCDECHATFKETR